MRSVRSGFPAPARTSPRVARSSDSLFGSAEVVRGKSVIRIWAAVPSCSPALLLTYTQSEIPEKWRAAALSKIEVPSNGDVRTVIVSVGKAHSPYAVVSRVSGFRDVITAMQIIASLMILQVPPCTYAGNCNTEHVCLDGDYVDLTLNPERFTGYVGPSSRRVWSAIYSENCFGLTQEVLNEPVPDITRAKGECLEQRVYYKIISGRSSPSYMPIQC